jgi:formate C-acetyltransferase
MWYYSIMNRVIARGLRELSEYYSEPAPGVEEVLQKIRASCDAHARESSQVKKSLIHEIIAGECAVKVFPHFPFFWEIAAGRSRYDWGLGSPLSNYLKDSSAKEWIAPYQRDIKPFNDASLLYGRNPVGYDHHCPGYDLILGKGIAGLIAEAKARRNQAVKTREQEFLDTLIRSNQALIRLAHRFAEEAERLLDEGQDEAGERNLRRIAAAARRVPEHPPETFYEALASILFIRECYGSLEAFGQSTFGHLDRLLYPYYEKDLAAGRISREEASDLIHALLAFTDAKFGINDGFYHETSTTVVIGGCDQDGRAVFNDITRMVAEACMEGRYIGTKIVARISGNHPGEYYSLLADFVSSGANTLVMPNDETLIPANRRWNKALEDCRLYVGGGCHEMVLANTEVNTRADTWINLPGLFLQTLAPGIEKGVEPLDTELPEGSPHPDPSPQFRRVPGFASATEAPDFEEFYARCMDNVRRFHTLIAGIKEKYERRWNDFDAAPLYSASILDCIKNGRDISAGGARYNSISLSMVGAATFIDSLLAVKLLVFDEKQLSLPGFWEILANNWKGAEPLRLYIRNRLPKFGTGKKEADAFGSRVLHDLSTMAGQPNGRGGIVTPAFYAHDLFRIFGEKTMATADGRGAGDYLSRGLSPSEFSAAPSVTDIISSLKSLDLSLFPESMATELTLPVNVGSGNGKAAVAALIKTFAHSGGSTLQINVFDRDALIRAKEEPGKYPNLVVRVCGYSQTFNSLPEEKKEEVISRAVRAV